MKVLGIDIGGSGIKAAVVDSDTGKLLTPRLRVDTPSPARPTKVIKKVSELAARFSWRGPIGVGFPGIIRAQVAHSAANLDRAWVGKSVGRAFSEAMKSPVWVINDADAAGIAEMEHGAGRKTRGTVLVLTLGTGIGSALFRDGVLVPNAELGHLEFKGMIAEKYAAASVRKRQDLRWQEWGTRVGEYLRHVDFLLSPDLIILGGGVSAKFEKFERFLKVDTRVVPAQMENRAGILGAAMAAVRTLPPGKLKVRSFSMPSSEEDN